MKHLKTYETLNDELQIGDYVICQENGQVDFFLLENIGQFVRYRNEKDKKETEKDCEYLIVFDINLDENDYLFTYFKHSPNYKYSRLMRRSEIIEFAPTKEELESKIRAKKYNI